MTGLLTSIVDVMMPMAGIVVTAGNFSAAIKIRPVLPNISISGVRTYWAGAGTTLHARLWSPAGVSVATGNVIIAVPGIYSIPFAAPYVLPLNGGIGLAGFYKLSVYSVDATYTRIASNYFALFPANANASPGVLARGLIWDTSQGYYAAADADPVTGIGNAYLLEPIVP